MWYALFFLWVGRWTYIFPVNLSCNPGYNNLTWKYWRYKHWVVIPAGESGVQWLLLLEHSVPKMDLVRPKHSIIFWPGQSPADEGEPVYCFILPGFSPFHQHWLVRVCFKPAVLLPDSCLPHALRGLEDYAGCAGCKGYVLACCWAISPYHCIVIPWEDK